MASTRQAFDMLARRFPLQRLRVAYYRSLWTANIEGAEPHLSAPVVMLGPGTVRTGERVTFGWERSQGFHDAISYVEVANEQTTITIGSGTTINNGVTLRAEGEGIALGDDCLLGPGVEIYDSDFHELAPQRRRSGVSTTAPVHVGPNVWLGSRAVVLRGVTIGAAAVVGAGAVVTGDVPAAAIVAGVPARVVGQVPAG